MTNDDRRPSRSRFAFADLLNEAAAGLFARPGRTVLTVLGTAVGVGTLVATLGIAKTAGNQIVTRFDVLAATHVVAAPASQGFFIGERQTSFIPFDAQDRLERLNGVVAAGTLSRLDAASSLVRSVPINDPLGQTEFQMAIYSTSPGLLGAVRGTMATGRNFDQGHSERADPVAILGPSAAQRLNINRVDQQPAIFVGDQALVVIGILDSVVREPGLLSAVLIPDGTARRIFGLRAPTEVHIDTEVGAAQLIADQGPIALSPNDPDQIRIAAPADPEVLRDAVQADVNSLFLLLGAITLLVGAIGIANVVLVSVIERISEIGLRRSVGAMRRHIAAQFLFESSLMGLVGGTVGASAGVIAVVTAAAINDWTPVTDAWVPLLAPLVGAAVGLLAGLYPALRAAALEPVEALRSAL